MAEAGINWEIEKDEEGYRLKKYYCTIDGKTLWIRYLHNDVEVVIGDCDHFHWESVGNGCYPFPIDEEICAGVEDIVKESIKKIEDGTTIYFLIQTQS
ncbi:hypothetical protein AVT98_gp37 [Sulfolobales virus YNP1]|uniref:hypothetical protein n=1 Tax=Sulfolobales virus YNP1 TaxID=1732179 RepID=UPI0007063336|nr:hypothetical protein AVT98_gp37 [Sulfolobales virus YNP1]ALG97129.1 hypothetical protein [Sulfolobales virus YNP1]